MSQLLHTPLSFDDRSPISIIGCILPPITVYKCISTMYGTNPKEVEKSKKIFALFISSSQEIVFDPRTDEAAKATFSEVFSHLVKFLQYMMLNGIYFSWISAYEFHPFGVVAARDGYISSPSNIICLRQLANNFSIARKSEIMVHFVFFWRSAFAFGWPRTAASLTTFLPRQSCISCF
uniref:Uncharacterized protein n=1 Tax=Corethron hystrix TaxID=216773 RepID=A0A7S1B930_9STRA